MTEKIEELEQIVRTKRAELRALEINLEINKLKMNIEKLEYEKKELKRSSDGEPSMLELFLSSDRVVLGKDERGVELYCREKVFVAAFNDFCRENHQRAPKWTSQYYAEAFWNNKIRLVRNGIRRYPNKARAESFTGVFYFGVDVANHDYVDEQLKPQQF